MASSVVLPMAARPILLPSSRRPSSASSRRSASRPATWLYSDGVRMPSFEARVESERASRPSSSAMAAAAYTTTSRLNPALGDTLLAARFAFRGLDGAAYRFEWLLDDSAVTDRQTRGRERPQPPSALESGGQGPGGQGREREERPYDARDGDTGAGLEGIAGDQCPVPGVDLSP